MSVWNFVSSLQATLDDAAGVDTRVDEYGNPIDFDDQDEFGMDGYDDDDMDEENVTGEVAAGAPSPKAAASGWGDEDSLDLSYGSEPQPDEDGQSIVPSETGQPIASPQPITQSPLRPENEAVREVSSSQRGVDEDDSELTTHSIPQISPEKPQPTTVNEEVIPQQLPDRKDLPPPIRDERTLESFVSPTRSDQHHPLLTSDEPSPPPSNLLLQPTPVAVIAAAALVPTAAVVRTTSAVDTLARSFDKEELTNLMRTNAELDGESKKLKLRVAKLEAKIQTIQSKSNVRADELLEEGKALARDLEKEQQTVRTLLDERGTRESQVITLTKQLEKSEKKLTGMTDECDFLSDKVKALVTELEHTKISHAQEVAELKNSLVLQYQATSEEASAVNSAAVRDAEDEINNLREEIMVLNSKLEDAEQRFSDKETSIRSEVDRKLMAAEREMNEANQRAMMAESRALEAARSGVEEGRSLVVELEQSHQQNDRLQTQIQTKQEQLRRREAEVESLHEDIAGLRATLDTTRKQLEESNARGDIQGTDEISRRDRELSTLRGLLQSAAQQDRQQKETIRQLEQAVARAVSERDAVQLVSSSVGSPVKQLPTVAVVPKQAPTPVAPTTRIEMELAQTSAKLAEALQNLGSKSKEYNSLLGDHDVLMQLYGEKEEEIMILSEKLEAVMAPTAKAGE